MRNINLYKLSFVLAILVICWANTLTAQIEEKTLTNTPLFESVTNPQMTEAQETYFNGLTENQLEFTKGSFANIRPENLIKGESVILNLPNEKTVTLPPSKVKYRNDGRVIWKAKDENQGLSAIFVADGDEITASITTGENVYYIYPLSGGLHYIQSLADVEADGCQMTAEKVESLQKNDNQPNTNKFEDDPITENYYGGECKVRLLVAYTNAVDAASANILNQIILYIEQYNTANGNSFVDHELELARAVEVNYAESFSSQTHPFYSNWTNTPTDLVRFWNDSDGFMDNVHGLRNLYDADMCMLMTTNLPGIGGMAFDYAPPADQSFCAMVWNNGIYQTFAHELGHLLGMHHDAIQDPSAGYYHGYIDVTGPTTFRTIMAYNNCGGTSCPVRDHWSNPYAYFNGNVTGTTHTHNNARVARENDHVIANYQGTVWNKSVFLNDNIRIRESGNIFADNTITTAGNTITYRNGSTGQYVADKSITFQTGFTALSGTEFRAFLDECSNVNFNEDGIDAAFTNPNEDETLEDELVLELTSGFSGLNISPNPASNVARIQYQLNQDENVEIHLTSLEGKQIQTILPTSFQSKGSNEIEFNVNDLAPGMYYVTLIFGKEKATQKLVVTK